MSEKAKQMLILFAGAIAVSGVITLQVRRSRPTAPIVTQQAETVGQRAATAPPALAPAPVAAPTIATGLTPAVVAPLTIAAGLTPAPAIVGDATLPEQLAVLPAGAWGRNPFLTPEEIAALAPQPLIPEIINLPEPILAPLPEQVRVLPQYTVSVIVAGEEGAWAVVDSRVVRLGDRLGEETVSQINDQGVVLERAGETRQVRINRSDILAPR